MSEMYKIRGNEISVIFQEPMTSLNPVFTVERQLSEPLRIHQGMSKAEAKKQAVTLLSDVKIPNPEVVAKQYPHQLSGGMRQRVMIAMALACKPKILIADEPTTALDVTIQAQVLDVLKSLQREQGTSLILITHDLSVVAHMADTVYVMYCGRIVEKAPLRELFHRPLHPYTRGLLAAVPSLTAERRRFIQIPDAVPSPLHKPDGCTFHPRCALCTEQCRNTLPPLADAGDGRLVRCWRPGEWTDDGGDAAATR